MFLHQLMMWQILWRWATCMHVSHSRDRGALCEWRWHLDHMRWWRVRPVLLLWRGWVVDSSAVLWRNKAEGWGTHGLRWGRAPCIDSLGGWHVLGGIGSSLGHRCFLIDSCLWSIGCHALMLLDDFELTLASWWRHRIVPMSTVVGVLVICVLGMLLVMRMVVIWVLFLRVNNH